MVDRVRDRRRHDRHGRQLAETFGSQRARLIVEFADKQGFKLWNARVGRKHRSEYSNCVVNARCTKTLAAIRRVIFGAHLAHVRPLQMAAPETLIARTSVARFFLQGELNVLRSC